MNQFKAWACCRHGAKAVALTALFAASSAAAFQVLPEVSDVDGKISSLGSNPVRDHVGHWFVGTAIPIMKSPVHEPITLAAIGCRADIEGLPRPARSSEMKIAALCASLRRG